MAKGQKRSNKERRKPKSEEKKPTGPKYLRPAELVQFAKAGAQSAGSKK